MEVHLVHDGIIPTNNEVTTIRSRLSLYLGRLENSFQDFTCEYC